jgi:hypothetical protein
MKEASKGKLPECDPLLVKMAASKRGSSSVSVVVSRTASTHPAQRRKNPMATMRDNATRVKRFRELKTTLRTNREYGTLGLL